MPKEPDMVMMNYNAVYNNSVKLTEALSASYVLIKKLESMKDIELDDKTIWGIEKLKEIMRSEGANI